MARQYRNAEVLAQNRPQNLLGNSSRGQIMVSAVGFEINQPHRRPNDVAKHFVGVFPLRRILCTNRANYKASPHRDHRSEARPETGVP